MKQHGLSPGNVSDLHFTESSVLKNLAFVFGITGHLRREYPIQGFLKVICLTSYRPWCNEKVLFDTALSAFEVLPSLCG